MSGGVEPAPRPSSELRTRLAERLVARWREIEQATLARVYAISDPAEVEDPSYVAGLREAVTAGLDYGLTAIERSGTPAPVPVQLLFQARYAARSGVSLDTVLRRCFAGYTVLSDFIVQEAEEDAVSGQVLQRALRGEAALLDRLIASISEEYSREADGRYRSVEERRAAQVRMVLGGELIDGPELGDYELDAWHLGAVATGPGARAAMKNLAQALDRRLLSVCAGEGELWGWLGGGRRVSSREALRLAEDLWPGQGTLALGEPGAGIEGWRLTHKQAKAALPIAMRGERRLLAYADVALFAAALNDEMLASSLRAAYLVPLEAERDGGEVLRRTLRAYFSAGRNASSAAAALGVSRKTVGLRLRTAERKIGQPLERCAAELETALRLREY